MNPSIESILRFARASESDVLLTPSRNRSFKVAIAAEGLEFTPSSSNKPRKEGRDRIVAVLEHFATTGSFRAADYEALSFNASYVLGLVKHWQAVSR